MSTIYDLLENITIVLVEPKYPENIGAAARIAQNMGIKNLTVISATKPDISRIKTIGTHNASQIIDNITFCDNLAAVLSGFCLAVGTTARKGRSRQTLFAPSKLYEKIVPYLKNNKVAIVFGPESRGLSNDEIKNCTILVSIPTAEFSSLNLGQAVAIICYEIHRGMTEDNLGRENDIFEPRLASIEEQKEMNKDIRQILTRVDALAGKIRPKSRLQKIYNIFGRRRLRANETRLISEICRQVEQVLPDRTID